MPDDNRFDEIGSALAGDDAEASDEAADSSASDDVAGTMADDEMFAKTSVYGHESTIEDYQSALRQAQAALIQDGIEDVKQRQLHDAALRIAARDPEEIAGAVKEVLEDDG